MEPLRPKYTSLLQMRLRTILKQALEMIARGDMTHQQQMGSKVVELADPRAPQEYYQSRQ